MLPVSQASHIARHQLPVAHAATPSVVAAIKQGDPKVLRQLFDTMAKEGNRHLNLAGAELNAQDVGVLAKVLGDAGCPMIELDFRDVKVATISPLLDALLDRTDLRSLSFAGLRVLKYGKELPLVAADTPGHLRKVIAIVESNPQMQSLDLSRQPEVGSHLHALRDSVWKKLPLAQRPKDLVVQNAPVRDLMLKVARHPSLTTLNLADCGLGYPDQEAVFKPLAPELVPDTSPPQYVSPKLACLNLADNNEFNVIVSDDGSSMFHFGYMGKLLADLSGNENLTEVHLPPCAEFDGNRWTVAEGIANNHSLLTLEPFSSGDVVQDNACDQIRAVLLRNREELNKRTLQMRV